MFQMHSGVSDRIVSSFSNACSAALICIPYCSMLRGYSKRAM